jgi:hypothetical protein
MTDMELIQQKLDESLFSIHAWEQDEINYREFLRKKINRIRKNNGPNR